MTFLGAIRPLAFPLILLALAWWLAPYAAAIPGSFAGLWDYGPWLLLLVASLLGLAYGRGRAVIATMLLGLGFTLVAYGSMILPDSGFALLTATILVPLNLGLIGLLRERGLVNMFGAMRVGVILLQLIVLAAVCFQWPDIASGVTRPVTIAIGEWPLTVSPALLAMGLAVFALLLRAFFERSRFAYALCVATGAYAGGIVLSGDSLLHAFVIAAAVMLAISILQDSWNMAYRDELTGLPQRRALNELFMTLGGEYTIAMMDVDHFKKFNDTHGHDVGDDVLKMVAAQIDRVKGGGRAYRYGGEEFTVVFPGKVKEQTLRHLEAVRESIENYEMVLRAPRQKGEPASVAERRGRGVDATQKTVSVTISIGVADRLERTDAADDILKHADEALYSAKKGGRNQVAVWPADKPTKKRARKAAA